VSSDERRVTDDHNARHIAVCCSQHLQTYEDSGKTMNALRKFAIAGTAAVGLTFALTAVTGAASYPPVTTPAPVSHVVTPPIVFAAIRTTTIAPTGSSAPVSLACTVACSGKIQLVETETIKVKQGKKTVTKTETIVLSSSTFKLAKGKSGTVQISLNSAAKTALKSKTVKVSLVETVSGKTSTHSIKG
jgi:hypothetical protein